MRWWGTRTVCHQTPCTLCVQEQSVTKHHVHYAHKNSLSPNTMYTTRTRTVCHQTPCTLRAQEQSVTKHHVHYVYRNSLSPNTMYTTRTRTVCHQTPCTLCVQEQSVTKHHVHYAHKNSLSPNTMMRWWGTREVSTLETQATQNWTKITNNKQINIKINDVLSPYCCCCFFPINTHHKPSELVIASVQ